MQAVSTPRANQAGLQTRHLLVAAVPLLLIAALVGIYLASPHFYLQFVLIGTSREHQAVELITFVCSALAGLLLLVSFRRLWRSPAAGEGMAERRGAAMIVGLIALATIFFAGEEISWGQSYFGWKSPESIKDHVPETNLHNIRGLPFSINSLGSLFLIIMFIVLPILWRWSTSRASNAKTARCLPISWEPAMAEGAVVFSMAVAFCWKFFKDIYKRVPEAEQTTFYVEFVEQINEQKEMLVAVTILMYALYRLAATKRLSGASRTS